MATATKKSAAPAVLDKFLTTETSINNRLVERSSIVRSSLIALTSRTHLFLLGEPGTAKSLQARILKAHIEDLQDHQYFERLLTRWSTDAEVFGPTDLLAMKQGVYRKVLDNKMVYAYLSFLDEIFKCNSSTLNSLLTILNERIFHNDEIVKSDLSSMFCASNELPQGEELNALADRIHLWHRVVPINESANFIQMLKSRMLGPVVPTLKWQDVLDAQAEVAKVVIPDEVLSGILQLREDLKRENVLASDRRWSDCQPIIQATAWFAGSDVATIDDLRDIRHMLWRTPSDQPIVDTHVLQLASPLEAEAMKLRDEIDTLAEEYEQVMGDSDNLQVRNRRAIDVHGKLERAANDIDAIAARMTAGRKSQIIEDERARLKTMNDTILREVFGVDPTTRKRKGSE
jgi:MoxR-like ATPase